ncbi:MAG TPA: tetraacyldisaccharide 4'-kinase [Terriglobia bacterium]|nr:tetraacyldisaccharide 4'-kinase [Terriglobia bacterium]
MRPLLAPLAAVYGCASSARAAAYQRGWIKAARLSRPVISVGNLTAGGTGKTPLVALIARMLLHRGLKPVILTRGYGRAPGPALIALDPATERSPDPRQAGDEPALLAADLPEVPIVISASRIQTGRYAEEHYQPDAHLLDDGFQHQQLARRLDIVALDATQPLSDRALIPAGRQRERCAALKRAHIIVLTRVEQVDLTAPIERQARAINPLAPIFHSRTELAGWLSVADGRRLPPGFLAGRRGYAFCGIGNPDAFFHNLGRWGITLAGKKAFHDHHVYRDSEIARLVIAARETKATLVTTAKDVMNLPADWRHTLPAFAALIEAEILEAAAFEKSLFDAL